MDHAATNFKLVKNLRGQVGVLLVVRNYGVGEERGIFLPDKHFFFGYLKIVVEEITEDRDHQREEMPGNY